MGWRDFRLNQGAALVARRLIADADSANVAVYDVAGATIVDAGVEKMGGLRAGRDLALACLAGLADVSLEMGSLAGRPSPKVRIQLDDPTPACLFSQYAGWKISQGKYFAMGSGPMRAIWAQEEILKEFGYAEPPGVAVGVLETSQLPNEDVVRYLAGSLGVKPSDLILLAARTASLAGTFQIVARSVETCLHKLHELGFDVTTIRAAIGAAPLPPIPKDDLTAIGRTNDAILYGGEVVLWVDADDDAIDAVIQRVPASASSDYGEPFKSIFRRYGGDFYKIDPLLFSPASVLINNLRTGRSSAAGATNPEVLAHSFFDAK